MAQSAATPVAPAVYVGRRVYIDYCSACHATDAGGSRLAPDLLARIRRLDLPAFSRILDGGYPGIENGPAPWGRQPEVGRYANELWAYLASRASGTIGPGELVPEGR